MFQLGISTIGVLFFIFTSLPAHAGENDPVDNDSLPSAAQKPLPKKKTTARRLASAEPRSYDQEQVRNGAESWEPAVEFTGGFQGGYAGLSGTDTNLSTSALGTTYSHSDVSLGLDADLRAWKYLGFEAEGFLGVASQNSDPSSSGLISRQLSGTLFDVKGQLPFYTNSVRWIPKAGLGFGYLQLNENTSSSSASTAVTTASDSTRVDGVYAVLGFDVEPAPDWTISADYAHSIGAQGSTTTLVGATQSPSLSLVDTNYDRLRVGVFYRIAPHFVVGGQFVRRSLSWGLGNTVSTTTTGDAVPTDTRQILQNQALGLFCYQL